LNSQLLNSIKFNVIKPSKKLNIKIFTFLLFIFFASFLWFLSKLSNEYTTIIKFPVVYKNLPENKLITNHPPDFLELKLSSYGFVLIRYSIFENKNTPLVIDFNELKYRRKHTSEKSEYQITAKDYFKIIENQINSELNLLEVHPDTIIFEYTNLITKTVKVRPVVNFTLANQYMLNGEIKCIPSTIKVKGISNIIDTLNSFPTISIKIGKLKKNFTKEVELASIDGLITEDKKVLINIPVDQFTEASIKVPIKIKNIPDSLNMKLFPSQANIIFNVPISQYKNITPAQFEIIVDFLEIKNFSVKRLPVKLNYLPQYIMIKKINPQFTEYIIEKK